MEFAHGPVAHQSPTEKVVEAVATHTGTDPLELPPLHGVIETDALNGVVRGLREGEVTFQYAGTAVTIRSDGTVDVADKHQAESVGPVSERTD